MSGLLLAVPAPGPDRTVSRQIWWCPGPHTFQLAIGTMAEAVQFLADGPCDVPPGLTPGSLPPPSDEAVSEKTRDVPPLSSPREDQQEVPTMK